MFWDLMNLQRGSFFAPVINGVVDIQSSFLFYILAFAGLIFAITIHEFAHAWSAHLLGDETARYNDRMNIDPTKHFDMFGFLLILFANFGYGKPVPVNPNNFKNPVFGNIMVSLAGPLSNLLQAAIYALLFLALKSLPVSEGLLTTLIYTIPTIGAFNVVLAVFNLLPIPPLDGSHIWGYISPAVDDFIQKIGQYSLIILILLLISGVLPVLFQPFLSTYSAILGARIL